MNRILVLTKYGSLGSSSRLRFYQYIPRLISDGFEVVTLPLLPDEYLQALYTQSSLPTSSIFASLARRASRLATARDYSLLWIEKEAFPWCPALLERRLMPTDVPYVVDYDDATFHTYNAVSSKFCRLLLRNKVAEVVRRASLVTVGNQYLAANVMGMGAHNVEIVPTVVDAGRYAPRAANGNSAFTIGWIGTPITFPFLEQVFPALEIVARQRPIRLVVIGATPPSLMPFPVETCAWSETAETREMATWDVGIMPLPDNGFTRGKCGYKLIQYMACSLPVVASPVGVNTQIVAHGRDGFLAESTEDWVSRLVELADNPSQAVEMGSRGRDKVEKHYSLEVAAPRMSTLLKDAACGPKELPGWRR